MPQIHALLALDTQQNSTSWPLRDRGHFHVFAWIRLHPPRYGQDESGDFAAEVGRGSPICSIDGSLPSISWPITVAAEAAPVLWHVERSMPAARQAHFSEPALSGGYMRDMTPLHLLQPTTRGRDWTEQKEDVDGSVAPPAERSPRPF